MRLKLPGLLVSVPLSAQVHYYCRRRRWMAGGCAAVPALATALVFLFGERLSWYPQAGWWLLPLLCMLTGVVGVICLYFHLQHSLLLYCVDHIGEYWVLRGADERFLRRLPEWSEAFAPK